MDPADIDSNLLSDPDDLKALVAVVELCREIGNSAALRPFLSGNWFLERQRIGIGELSSEYGG
jgi:hypothetical protein